MNAEITLTIALGTVGLLLFLFLAFTLYVLVTYTKHIDRIFEHKPLLVAPKRPPRPDVERVEFAAPGGRKLVGGYVRSSGSPRRGVILFCHEYTADRWLFDEYVGYLTDDGFDIFSFDFCNHGESDAIPGYDPLQWVTEHEVQDVRAAIAYLRSRPDAPSEIGIFGVSKGGGAAIMAASRQAFIKAVATDGAFPTHGTMTHYEMVWVEIYSSLPNVYKLLPRWYYAMVGEYVLLRLRKRRKVRYSRIERGMRGLGKRSLFMIHGGRDNYIKPVIVERLFALASGPKELWIVEKAKHNGCLAKAGEKYRERVRSFFRVTLAGAGSGNGDQVDHGHRVPSAADSAEGGNGVATGPVSAPSVAQAIP